jgi:hypothetical protein
MNDEVKQTTAAPTGADTAQLIAAILLVLGGIVAYYLLKSRPEAWASWVALQAAQWGSAVITSRITFESTNSTTAPHPGKGPGAHRC